MRYVRLSRGDIFRVTNAGAYGKLKAQTLTGRRGGRDRLKPGCMEGTEYEGVGTDAAAAADVRVMIRSAKRIAE